MLFGFIIILIAIVLASYFALYPVEFKLKTGTTVEKPVTQPAPAPATSKQAAPEPVTPEQAAPEPVTPEQVAPEPVTPEQVAPEPATSNMDLPQANKITFVWAVNLISLPTQSSAGRITDQLKTERVETEVVQINIKNRTYYRVRIPNLTSKQEADEAHAAFKDNPAYKGAWINRYRK